MFNKLLVILCIVGFVGVVQAQNTTLTWDAPTTNADGTPLTDLKGYKVFCDGDEQGIDVGNVTTYPLSFLEGSHSCFTRAYDDKEPANESVNSNIATKVIAIPPSPPTGCALTN